MIYKNNEKIFHEKEYILSDNTSLPLLAFWRLEQIPGIRHCFTTREGGVSEGIFSSLNLSFSRGDDRSAVAKNYARVAEAMGCSSAQIVTSDQTHTIHVRKVDQCDAGKGVVRPRDYRDVDALITNEPGLLLGTFFADCVPLYFVDPVKRAIGLAHSGWRGTVQGMGAAVVKAMQEAFETRAEDLICAIGPSICQDCYQVGEDVARAFEESFRMEAAELLRPEEDGKFRLNLWKANEKILIRSGVRPENVIVTNLCTCCNPKRLFSHRASRGKRGNLGAFLMLSEEAPRGSAEKKES